MNAVLIGNYGVGNFGDEALREYFLRAFPGVRWTVVSARPAEGELPRLPMGVRSFFRTPWSRTLRTIRRSDAVVFGGGTLFTDIESVKACFLWGVHALAARAFGVPYHLAFQGIGPFKTRVGERIARWVVRSARHVSVRDAASAARVAAWRKDAVETFDPVFLHFQNHKRDRAPANTYLLIPRHTSGASFRAALEAHATNLRHVAIVIALFQPDDARERNVVETIRRSYPEATVRTIRETDDLMELLSSASHCVCERFHGALAAIAAGTPLTIVAQAEGDKLSAIRELSDQGRVDEAIAAAERGERALREALAP